MRHEATFEISVVRDDEKDGAECHVEPSDDEDFAAWMCATEYMMHLTATKSGAGYERAMELLFQGAMEWQHKEVPNA